VTAEDTRGLSTVAEAPPWERRRERPTWGLEEGDAIAPGRTVLRQLGGGRRYEVFLVWDDHRLAVLVAKVLRPEHARARAALAELTGEAEALARLAHPVIMRGFDAVVDGRFPHLLVEHLEGPTLRELIERGGALPLEQTLPLGLHVASALHYLAAEEMVHLDVKPDNIVMGAPPRLIDFSVARSLAAARRLRRPVGTNAYMAPEQRNPAPGPDSRADDDRTAPVPNSSGVGPPADVFGLAATLHHAVTGHRDRAEAFPRHVPRALADLLRAGLAPEPADRPTAAELAGGLEPLVASLPRRPGLGRRH
jgi:eukaryotic-like serine/threonine-protein kinase